MLGAVGLLATVIAVTTLGHGDSVDVRRAPPGETSTAPTTKSAAPRLLGVASMTRSVPLRIKIPALGVDAGLMSLGLQADETLEVPPGGFPAGWYRGSPTPGEQGPAIVAGHVHYDGLPGVFYRLSTIKPRDVVTITRKDGSTAMFRVGRVETYAKDVFPTSVVYGNIDHPGLRLITCGGLDPQRGTYEDNVVVFADLVAPRRPVAS